MSQQSVIPPIKINTGLRDSGGDSIHIGDVLRIDVASPVYGDWLAFRVEARGMTPVGVCVAAANASISEGSLSFCLADLYPEQQFFHGDLSELRPKGPMTIIPQ